MNYLGFDSFCDNYLGILRLMLDQSLFKSSRMSVCVLLIIISCHLHPSLLPHVPLEASSKVVTSPIKCIFVNKISLIAGPTYFPFIVKFILSLEKVSI